MYRELNTCANDLATEVIEKQAPVVSLPDTTFTFPKLRAEFDGGLRNGVSAYAWVLKACDQASPGENHHWRVIARAGNVLPPHSTVALAELTAACEATKAAAAFVRGSLEVDSATAQVVGFI